MLYYKAPILWLLSYNPLTSNRRELADWCKSVPDLPKVKLIQELQADTRLYEKINFLMSLKGPINSGYHYLKQRKSLYAHSNDIPRVLNKRVCTTPPIPRLLTTRCLPPTQPIPTPFDFNMNMRLDLNIHPLRITRAPRPTARTLRCGL